jgi:uncharacterized membrane protein
MLVSVAACDQGAGDGDRASSARSDAALSHKCGGTEPFWSLNITPDGMTFDSPEDAFEMPAVSRAVSASSSEYAQALHTTNATTGAKVSIVLLEGACNDGMSETNYRYHVLMRDDSRVLYGCCDAVADQVTPSKPLPQIAAKQHVCHGTEPFWTIKIADAGITLSSPFDEDLEMPGSSAIAPVGMNPEFAMVFQTQNPKTGAPVAISLVQGLCNDGMSETEYAYSALIEQGDTLLVGCCDELGANEGK